MRIRGALLGLADVTVGDQAWRTFSVFTGTAVLPRLSSSCWSAVRSPDQAPSSQSALFGR